MPVLEWGQEVGNMTYEIQGCCFCQECQYVCPVGAIYMDAKGAHINQEICIGCGSCAKNCASEAIICKE